MQPSDMIPPAVMARVMNQTQRHGGLPPNVHPLKHHTMRGVYTVTPRWVPREGGKADLVDWQCDPPSPLDPSVRQQRRALCRWGELRKNNKTGEIKHLNLNLGPFNAQSR